MDKEFEGALRAIHAEIDMLRARNDGLTIALRHVISFHPNPRAVAQQITRALENTEGLALFSDVPSEAYLTALGALHQRVGKWFEAPPDVAR